VTYDFSKAEHLPNNRSAEQGHADPAGLPRQRRGTTPQMHGRYPDYDVLEQAAHWDEVTRQVVFDRLQNIPEFRFFTPEEVDTLRAFCDVVLAQDTEPRIPVLEFVDEKLFHDQGDGYQYFDMPDDGETWRVVARGLDVEARREGKGSFSHLTLLQQIELCHRFANGKLHGDPWNRLNVSRAWQTLLRHASQAFYSHPWAWNEIGFGGPAYPRGYARFGSPHLRGAEREEWEGAPAYERDPVRDVEARGLE
jgi:hypothetical protein